MIFLFPSVLFSLSLFLSFIHSSLSFRIFRYFICLLSLSLSVDNVIIYIMRSALRTEENPALSVAASLSRALSAPFLVYSFLLSTPSLFSNGAEGGNENVFNNERHCTFFLEGIEAVQQSLQKRKVPFIFERSVSINELVGPYVCLQ